MIANLATPTVFCPNSAMWNMSPWAMQALETICDPESLWRDVASPVIQRWCAKSGLGDKFCLVSGAISSVPPGTPEEDVSSIIVSNLRTFQAAIWHITACGLLKPDGTWEAVPGIFTQMPFEGAMGRYHTYYQELYPGKYPMPILQQFYLPLLARHTSHLLVLPGWELSYGARWERRVIAETLGMPERILEVLPKQIELALAQFPDAEVRKTA